MAWFSKDGLAVGHTAAKSKVTRRGLAGPGAARRGVAGRGAARQGKELLWRI